MKRVFKVLSYGLVKLEQIPRDWWFSYTFREDDSIKAVCVYAKEFSGDKVDMAFYDEFHDLSTFIALKEMWRVLQGVEDGDWLFFGKMTTDGGSEWEWGYFTLSQLQEIRFRPFGLGVERDMYFKS